MDSYAAELLVLDRAADALDASNEALASWREAGERVGLGASLRSRCAIFRARGEGEAAITAARASVAALEGGGDSLELTRSLAVLAQIQMIRGELKEGEELAERGLAMEGDHRDESLEIHLLTTLGATRAAMGERRGIDLLRATLARAQAAGLDEATARVWFNLIGNGAVPSHAPAEALVLLEEALRFAHSHEVVQVTHSMECLAADVLH